MRQETDKVMVRYKWPIVVIKALSGVDRREWLFFTLSDRDGQTLDERAQSRSAYA